MFAAIIAVTLIIVFAAWWRNTPDVPTKGNPSFHQDSFDKEAWKNFDVHHESDNHLTPEDYMTGKYNGINQNKK